VAALTLVIGNKNYSSWSMRPWVLLRELGIPFEEKKLRFGSEEWAREIGRWSPSGMVPVLWRGREAVWDTLAILETLAEWHPDKGVWPADPAARAFARSMSAEMHAGFRDLRTTMPMNIRASHPGKGMTPATRANIARIEALWGEARRRFGAGGPFLFGAFCAADAMYAPVVARFHNYGLPVQGDTLDYMAAVMALPAWREWYDSAMRETWIMQHNEPEWPLVRGVPIE